MIEINNITFGYNKSLPIIHDLNYSFTHAGLYILTGRNGAGKSTLFNLISGNLIPSNGAIKIDSQDTNLLSQDEKDSFIKNRIAYYHQNEVGINSITVLELFKLFKIDENKTRDIITTLNLEDIINCKVKNLSQGEKQRLFVGITLCQDKPIYLLDEPFAHLDQKNKIKMLALLDKLSKDRLIIIISHEKDSFYNDVNHILLYFDGLTIKEVNKTNNYLLNIKPHKTNINKWLIIKSNFSNLLSSFILFLLSFVICFASPLTYENLDAYYYNSLSTSYILPENTLISEEQPLNHATKSLPFFYSKLITTVRTFLSFENTNSSSENTDSSSFENANSSSEDGDSSSEYDRSLYFDDYYVSLNFSQYKETIIGHKSEKDDEVSIGFNFNDEDIYFLETFLNKKIKFYTYDTPLIITVFYKIPSNTFEINTSNLDLIKTYVTSFRFIDQKMNQHTLIFDDTVSSTLIKDESLSHLSLETPYGKKDFNISDYTIMDSNEENYDIITSYDLFEKLWQDNKLPYINYYVDLKELQLDDVNGVLNLKNLNFKTLNHFTAINNYNKTFSILLVSIIFSTISLFFAYTSFNKLRSNLFILSNFNIEKRKIRKISKSILIIFNFAIPILLFASYFIVASIKHFSWFTYILILFNFLAIWGISLFIKKNLLKETLLYD